MKAVWKYQIPMTTRFSLMMPVDAQPIAVQMQGDTPTMWALVTPSDHEVEREFHLAGTGHVEVTARSKYIGTFQKDWFVGHVFEIGGAM